MDSLEMMEEAKELFNSSAENIKRMDRNVLLELRKSGEATVSKLSLLKASKTVETLLVNFREFGAELVTFLEHSVARYQDTKWWTQRQAVLTHADCLRSILPSLMETMREVMKASDEQHVLSVRDTFFSIAENSINGIISSYKYLGSAGQTEDGLFITKMDAVFRQIDGEEEPDIEEVDTATQWLLSHALAVAKGTNQEEEEEITTACRKILFEVKRLKTCEGQQQRDCLAVLGRSYELLEQNVNGALLRLAISCLTSVHQPLDNLISAALSSDRELSARLSDDLSQEVRQLDLQSDQLLQLCHFCVFCTTEESQAQALRSSSRLLECLEAELVPSVLQLYFSPGSRGARATVAVIRQSWRGLLEQIQGLVTSIVDPTAFCVILLQSLESLARALKSNLYSQDPATVQAGVSRLLSMAETGVDLAWRELGDLGTVAPLPDSHCLVTAERSVWEVRAACKLLVRTIQDLSLHQALIKRVQVLLAAFQGLVTLLTEKAEDSLGGSSSLLFPSRLVADSNMKTPRVAAAASRNNTNFLSFRSKKNLDKTAMFAGEVREEIYKITVDLTPFTPRPEAVPKRPTLKRKPSKVTVNGCLLQSPIRKSPEGSRIVRRSSARLSSVISELSVLSHELSVCLEVEDKEQPGKENSWLREKLEERNQNNSLRRVALRNISNKVTLTSASNIAI